MSIPSLRNNFAPPFQFSSQDSSSRASMQQSPKMDRSLAGTSTAATPVSSIPNSFLRRSTTVGVQSTAASATPEIDSPVLLMPHDPRQLSSLFSGARYNILFCSGLFCSRIYCSLPFCSLPLLFILSFA